VSDLAAALDALCATEPGDVADGETLRQLSAQLDRLSALVTRATAAFDTGREWEAEGARSAPAWVAARCHLPVPVARRRVRLGRCLRRMGATETAWLVGEVTEPHVEALAATRTRVGAERFDSDESMLVDAARTLRYCHFLRVLAYWEQAADPDGVEEHAAGQRAARRLHLSQSFEGMWFLDGILDPIAGEVVPAR
jgi:hypothetical protein